MPGLQKIYAAKIALGFVPEVNDWIRQAATEREMTISDVIRQAVADARKADLAVKEHSDAQLM